MNSIKKIGIFCFSWAMVAILSLPLQAQVPAVGGAAAADTWLTSFLDFITGKLFVLICTVAVIGVAYGALKGRIDWKKAGIIILGIIIILSAESIAVFFLGGINGN